MPVKSKKSGTQNARIVATSASATPRMSRQKAVEAPDWPPMQPLIPAADLAFEVLLKDQVLTIPNFWTAKLCRDYTAFLSTLPLVTTPGVPKRGDAVRVNDRFQVDDPVFAERLWSDTSLKELTENFSIDGMVSNEDEQRAMWGGKVLGLNSNIRVYRYKKGQFFDKHYDDSNSVSFPSSSASNAIPGRTTWTLLIYLSSQATGCIGGQTAFYPEPQSKHAPTPPAVVADVTVGTALLHRHGKDCLLHEGREVLEGEKWVIRSDICVRR